MYKVKAYIYTIFFAKYEKSVETFVELNFLNVFH